MWEEEEIKSLEQLCEKLAPEGSLPSGWCLMKSPKVCLVKYKHSEENGLDFHACVELQEDLNFKMYFCHDEIDRLTEEGIDLLERPMPSSLYPVDFAGTCTDHGITYVL